MHHNRAINMKNNNIKNLVVINNADYNKKLVRKI